MRRELNRLPIAGRIVIGEGERDEAPMLFIGEEVGTGRGPAVDIAVDPLEGTTLCAKNMPGSIAVMAMAEGGTLLNAPDVYMDKIAIGPGYAKGVIDLDASPEENIHSLAKAKGVKPNEITALILDRPRHAGIIAAVRNTGASVQLITDGDVAGVIHTTDPDETGVDIYLGTGGAPEGVLAAAALRCIGGQMYTRLDPRHRGEARPRQEDGRGRSEEGLRHLRHGARRLPDLGDRGVDRQHAEGREVRQGRHQDPHRGHALGLRHGALDRSRAPRPFEVRLRLIRPHFHRHPGTASSGRLPGEVA